jgi:hypothetical protein
VNNANPVLELTGFDRGSPLRLRLGFGVYLDPRWKPP